MPGSIPATLGQSGADSGWLDCPAPTYQLLCSAAWIARGRVGVRFAGCALHELPRSAECYREAPNQYEGEIIDQIDVMGMQNERYG